MQQIESSEEEDHALKLEVSELDAREVCHVIVGDEFFFFPIVNAWLLLNLSLMEIPFWWGEDEVVPLLRK